MLIFNRLLIIVCILLIWNYSSIGQNILSESITQANDIIETVESDKYVYNQSIKMVDEEFSIVEVSVEKINIKKSKSESATYLFNLALLNKAKVERKVKKSEMALVLNSTDGNYILRTEDGEKSKYIDNLKMICADVDVLRDLEKLFKDIIEGAQSNWEISLEKSLSQEYTESLPQKIKDLKYASGFTVNQDINFDFTLRDLVSISMSTSNGKKQESFSYNFSLANLDQREIKTKTKNDAFWLNLCTLEKLKKIVVNEDDETKFISDFDLYFESPTEALIAAHIFKNTIEEMRSIYMDRVNAVSECTNCVEVINDLLKGSGITGFNISDTCDSEISLIDGDDKINYIFNWGDVMAKASKMKFNTSSQDLTIQADGKIKYFGIYEDGVLSKYDNKIKLKMTDVETAESILYILPKVAESCEQKFESQELSWLINSFEDGLIQDRYEQSLDANEEKSCAYIFKKTDQEKNKFEEYEFNFYDVDSRQLELSISGKDIELDVKTKNKEKIFTKHDEKGKLSYSNNFSMMFSDVKSLRIAKETFKAAADKCK